MGSWLRPWMLPVGMAGFSASVFLMEFILTGRVKPNMLKYTITFTAAIPAAVRGDLTPFITAFVN